MAFGGLLLAAVLLDDLADRVKLPGILLVLALGLLVDNDLRSAGEPLLSLTRANNITQSALVLVLFFGGLTTNWGQMRAVIRPAAWLATVGVLITAGLLTLIGIGMLAYEGSWDPTLLPKVLFIGAMFSSTDASAALSLLRPLAGRMPQKVLDLIEMESTIDDPMAVVLAGLALALAGGEGLVTADLLTDVIRQFLLGGLLGFIGGSVISSCCWQQFAAPRLDVAAVIRPGALGGTLLGGAPLAAYVDWHGSHRPAGAGRSPFQLRQDGRVDAVLCLGLVVAPQDVVRAGLWAMAIFAAMQLVRWLMVQVLLFKGAFDGRQKQFICWTGLRGAVPIAMAIQAWASPVAWGKLMPPLALAVVLLGLVIQGFALVPIAHRLGLVLPSPAEEAN